MERRIIVFCVLVISLVLLPLAISAQEEEKSATGCFNKADREGYYVLTDKSSGEEIIVTGLDALEPHSSNHEVTVTGMMMTEDDGNEVLKATAIQHIAGTCTAP